LQNKSGFKQTIPRPFNFHEPKNNVELRTYLDDENQLINPTMKKRAGSVRALNADLEAPMNPPTTKKHEALVAMRREAQTLKNHTKIEK
jgi:hypothetical protein